MKKDGRSKILTELASAITILFVIAIILNGYAIYRDASSKLIKEYQDSAVGFLKYESSFLSPDEASPEKEKNEWCVDFWLDNSMEVMQKVRELSGYGEIAKEIKDLTQKTGHSFYSEITITDIESMDHEDQLSFAVYKFVNENMLYNTWRSNDTKMSDQIIRSFLFDEDGNAVMLLESNPRYVTGELEDDNFNLSFNLVLGERRPFNIYNHPAAIRAQRSKKIEEEPEKTLDNEEQKAKMSYFAPVLRNGEVVGMIMVSYEWTDTLKDIWNSVVGIEMINLIALILTELLLLLIVYFAAVRPLKDIQKNVRVYSENKDSTTIINNVRQMHYFNEFGILADDIASLAAEMERYTGEMSILSSEREKKNTELDIAKKIQLQNLPNTFPAFPERDDLDIYASMDAAFEVGGDFYDFFFVDDDHLALVIADVSGKGVPAALYMMRVKTYIKEAVMEERSLSPGRILEKANLELSRGNDTLVFVTVWLGILSVSGGRLVCANAGHEKILIKRAGEDFGFCKDNGGMVLGLVEDNKYNETEFELEREDVIFVYTDGVTEAMNAQGKPFGKERMLHSLNTHKDETVREIIAGVREDVALYVGETENSDDVTMLAVKLL